MSTSWKTESGQLLVRWFEVGEGLRCNADWMRESPGMSGSYLEPVPDFAAHSPFGGPSWFDPQYRKPRT
jgi:hypothetical protein